MVDIDCNRRGTTLTTREGIHIHGRHVVFCTGYELAKIVPPGRNKILSTWAIATRPQPRAIWPQKALIWESSEPYLDLRATEDGRVICGGEDEEFSDTEKRDALTPLKTRRIEHKLEQYSFRTSIHARLCLGQEFGGVSTACQRSGAIPGYPKCYAVMGYGGNGITFSMLSDSTYQRGDPRQRNTRNRSRSHLNKNYLKRFFDCSSCTARGSHRWGRNRFESLPPHAFCSIN